mmetsp:Transcript_8080/g.25215  ORF Transcript_8080/g.25215 Transcript_8080/m.25215 type:complete len:233 (-) Transcript_8080:71-769(-)
MICVHAIYPQPSRWRLAGVLPAKAATSNPTPREQPLSHLPGPSAPSGSDKLRHRLSWTREVSVDASVAMLRKRAKIAPSLLTGLLMRWQAAVSLASPTLYTNSACVSSCPHTILRTAALLPLKGWLHVLYCLATSVGVSSARPAKPRRTSAAQPAWDSSHVVVMRARHANGSTCPVQPSSGEDEANAASTSHGLERRMSAARVPASEPPNVITGPDHPPRLYSSRTVSMMAA